MEIDRTDIRTYEIDTVRPTCWNELVLEYKPQILKVMAKMKPLTEQYLTYINLGYGTYKMFGGIVLFENEIKEIAKILDITTAECLLFQLTYELCSACTTAIMKCDGNYVLSRTMDWELPELKAITVKVDLYYDRVKLCEAITWAGFVGLFTGIKPGRYAIALNYRRSTNPSYLENLKAVFLGYYPNAFYIRTLLESQSNPDEIKYVKLISPAYFTVLTGYKNYVIIRDRTNYRVKEAPVVQTNCDGVNTDTNIGTNKYIGDNIMNSYERIEYMEKIIHRKDISLDELIEYINQYPLNQQATIYTCIMSVHRFLYCKVN